MEWCTVFEWYRVFELIELQSMSLQNSNQLAFEDVLAHLRNKRQDNSKQCQDVGGYVRRKWFLVDNSIDLVNIVAVSLPRRLLLPALLKFLVQMRESASTKPIQPGYSDWTKCWSPSRCRGCREQVRGFKQLCPGPTMHRVWWLREY